MINFSNNNILWSILFLHETIPYNRKLNHNTNITKNNSTCLEKRKVAGIPKRYLASLVTCRNLCSF